MASRTRRARLLRYALAGTLVVGTLFVAGCVRVSNGTWYIQSAATPEGWPELTPVGGVEVKDYPESRAAVVTEVEVGASDTRSMFTALFDHISANDISMTAPVDMGYTTGPDAPRMASMAFLYRRPDQGTTGRDGAVRVEDLAPRTYASTGVRGSYTTRTFEKGLARLRTWLDENAATWTPAGPPRFLGYNAPFIPVVWRYGEVQIPVVPAADPS